MSVFSRSSLYRSSVGSLSSSVGRLSVRYRPRVRKALDNTGHTVNLNILSVTTLLLNFPFHNKLERHPRFVTERTTPWKRGNYLRGKIILKIVRKGICKKTGYSTSKNDTKIKFGSNLASEIQPSTIEPEFYLQPTDTIFSLKAPSASSVSRLLNQLDTKKPLG